MLERLLLDFDGSVLLVTHDRYFLDKVATAILAFEGGGRITRWEGNYDLYRRLKDQAERAARGAESRPSSLSPTGGEGRGEGAAARKVAPPARKPGKLSFKEQRELEGIEAAILEAEDRKVSLEAALSDPATYQRGGAAVAGLKADLDAATAEVERLYARWQELEALRAGST